MTSFRRFAGRLPALLSIGRNALGLEASHAAPMQAYLRLLGGVYAIAFVSLAVQIRGLVGSDGLLPAGDYLRRVHDALGAGAGFQLPTVFWLSTDDRWLVALAWIGAFAGILVATGLFQAPLLLLAWVLYLSYVSIGQVFLNYQWDMLLLEAGFLAPWVASWRPLVRWMKGPEPPWLLVALHRWLLFRLMFASGWVKIRQDAVWRDLSALDYHFWTQPLPTWTAWWAHQAPESLRHAATAGALAIELIGPPLIFLGMRARRLAFVVFGALQLAIAATGNYGFFNLLTFALGVTLLESRFPSRVTPEPPPEATLPSPIGRPRGRGWAGLRRAATLGLTMLVALLSVGILDRWVRDGTPGPSPLSALEAGLAPFRLVNTYGLFAVMTEERPEILIETSRDGQTWTAVEFHWKPGNPASRPRFTLLHLPRLDWQMWFEALNFLAQDDLYRLQAIAPADRRFLSSAWFQNLLGRLVSPPNAAADLTVQPHAAPPPSWIRARVYRYRFASPEVRRASGHWWRREEVGPYVPELTLVPPPAPRLNGR